MVKKNFHRNKRKSISRIKTKRLKRRKSLFHKKTKRLKKRKSQKNKINYQMGGANIDLNHHIRPDSKEELNTKIDEFIEKFLSDNKDKKATLMKPEPEGTYTNHGSKNRDIVDYTKEELERTGSPASDGGI